MREYGILQEKSDVRAHVSPTARAIYVFRTKEARKAVESKEYRLANASQPGVVGSTASGWLVPPSDIRGIIRVAYDERPWWEEFAPELSTSEKGVLAVRLCQEVMSKGGFPFWVNPDSPDYAGQLAGGDLIVTHTAKIQVKCDYRAGEGQKGCTGNLFLQKAESNPIGMI